MTYRCFGTVGRRGVQMELVPVRTVDLQYFVLSIYHEPFTLATEWLVFGMRNWFGIEARGLRRVIVFHSSCQELMRRRGMEGIVDRGAHARR